jgi:hypothetical protein
VGYVLFDGDFRRRSGGRKRRGSGDPDLRGIASGAKRSAVLDVGAAFITGMFH